MTSNRILIFSTLLMFAPTSLLRAEEKLDCANAMTQADMNQCAHTDFVAGGQGTERHLGSGTRTRAQARRAAA